MIRTFQFTFDELNIGQEDLSELLGFENEELPDPFPELIGSALKEGEKYCNIKGGYRYFDTVDVNTQKETINIEGMAFSPSKIVTTQLKTSSSAALFVCTAGSGFSEQAKILSDNGDPMSAYVVDVLGSVTVEKAMDKIQASLYNEVAQEGLSISDRYSPGYCEWSVAEQQMLFSLLPDEFCGIQLSESSLMHPIKSVSGIIGIGEGLSQKGYQCQWCNDGDCIYGKLRRRK